MTTIMKIVAKEAVKGQKNKKREETARTREWKKLQQQRQKGQEKGKKLQNKEKGKAVD
jgi:hypothetical protein